MFDALPELPLDLLSGAALPAKLSKRDAIKAAGGAPYDALLAKERVSRAEFRKRHPEKTREYHRKRDKRRARSRSFKARMVVRARRRARSAGLVATITVADLVWPSHCPVLGLELDYLTPSGSRLAYNPANPSLDRYDPKKGYVPGNVFVISYRANTLKNNGTYEEMLKVAKYLARPPRYDR